MKIKLALILALYAAITGGGNALAQGGEIAVIMSRRLAPFDTALEGFKQIIDRPYQIYDLAGMGKRGVIGEIMHNDPPKLVLAIGSGALFFAWKNFTRVPIVFTMVTNPSRIVRGQRENVSGVRMETPWEVMFKHLREISPHKKRVGIILNPLNVEENAEYIKNISEKYSLETDLRVVGNASQAISEFKNIEDRIEAFLMVPDPGIFTPKFYEYILLSSLRHKFILVGLSNKYTKAGSLFSVMGDNHDWGVQAGLIAKKILSGTNPTHIPYGFAKKYSLSINLKTANIIGIEIPEAIKKRALDIVE